MSTGNLPQKEKTKTVDKSPTDYKYGDEVFTETGRKSRGGLSSLDELYAPGVERVSGEILQTTYKAKITLALDSFTCNSACVRLFPYTQYIEFVFDKPNGRLIVFPSTAIPKDSVKFAVVKENNNKPRKTVTKKFCALVFRYMNWSADCRYRIMAIYKNWTAKN